VIGCVLITRLYALRRLALSSSARYSNTTSAEPLVGEEDDLCRRLSADRCSISIKDSAAFRISNFPPGYILFNQHILDDKHIYPLFEWGDIGHPPDRGFLNVLARRAANRLSRARAYEQTVDTGTQKPRR
jgi:hypothetical protein